MPPTYTSRLCDPLIAGTIIRIAKFGETSGSNTIGANARPAAPTDETPGPWLTLGKIKSSQSERQEKSATVEGCLDTGTYEFREIRLATTNKLKFTTQWITPEAIQLAFGLKNAIVDGTAQVPFESSGNIRVWLYGKLTDAGGDGKTLAEFTIMGDLSLTSSPNWASDPTTAEFELSVIHSDLAEFTGEALAKLGS